MGKNEEKARNEPTDIELTLRPQIWDEYVGQEKVKQNLRLIIDAAKKRGESCDHLLFYGQAGLGKTTLAYLVGKEMDSYVKSTTGPALEKPGDVAALLSNVEPHEILFIDEAHRINKLVEEILYPALESRKLHLIVGKGSSARTFSLDIPPFTVIAATTKVNLISAPLRSRFGATFKLDYYLTEDIERIVRRSAEILNAEITDEAVEILARASRFTPRTANRLLKRARDYADVYGDGKINAGVAKKTLELLQVDSKGLEESDRELLRLIIEKYDGGPVGLKAIAAALAEEMGTIEDVYEPFLMRLGLLERKPSGRVATHESYKHLDIQPKRKLV